MKLQTLFEEGVQNIAAAVKERCGPFIKESGFDPGNKKTWMRRGIRLASWRVDGSGIKFNRLYGRERGPSDTARVIHEVLDSALKELTGVKFRSQGTFAFSESGAAPVFGNPCLFFPIGKFDYCWSPKIYDATMAFDNGARDQFPVSDQAFLEKRKGNWKPYLDEMREFIISGKAEYLFNSGLKDALKKDNEIMFRCDSYYLISGVSVDEFIEEFKKL